MQKETQMEPSRKSRSKTLNFNDYEYDEKMSRPHRAAHALDWAATHFPNQWVAYNVLLKAITDVAHTPRLNNPEVERLRSCMSRVRAILADQYERGVTTEIGLGIRATSDHWDTLKTDMVAQSKRYASVTKSYARTGGLIDVSKIKPTEENKRLLAWMKQEVRPRLAQIQSPDYLLKLLPPIEDDDEDGEK